MHLPQAVDKVNRWSSMSAVAACRANGYVFLEVARQGRAQGRLFQKACLQHEPSAPGPAFRPMVNFG